MNVVLQEKKELKPSFGHHAESNHNFYFDMEGYLLRKLDKIEYLWQPYKYNSGCQ